MHTKVIVRSHFGLNGERISNMLTTVLKHMFPRIIYFTRKSSGLSHFFINKETKKSFLIPMNKRLSKRNTLKEKMNNTMVNILYSHMHLKFNSLFINSLSNQNSILFNFIGQWRVKSKPLSVRNRHWITKMLCITVSSKGKNPGSCTLLHLTPKQPVPI